MITEKARVKASSRISIADLGGEAVILDPETGQYFGLNKVGLFIVERLKDERTIDALVEEVAEHFGIGREQAEADLVGFIDELQEAKLVSARPE
jgi:hypothetical protein